MTNQTNVVTDQNFQEEVIKASQAKPVLVDFWATWCGPCQMQAPILEEIAKELGEKIKIAKLDVDQNQTKASEYQIQSIPLLKLFKNGQVVEDLIGLQMKAPLLETLKKYL